MQVVNSLQKGYHALSDEILVETFLAKFRGDLSAGSPTDTLLRLDPPHEDLIRTRHRHGLTKTSLG